MSDKDGERIDQVTDFDKRPMLTIYEIGQGHDVRELDCVYLHIKNKKPRLSDLLAYSCMMNYSFSVKCYEEFVASGINWCPSIILVDLDVLHAKTGQLLNEYKMFWPIKQYEILNPEKTNVEKLHTDWRRKERWVSDQSRIPSVDLFQAKETSAWIASGRFRSVVMNAGFTGFVFTPIEV